MQGAFILNAIMVFARGNWIQYSRTRGTDAPFDTARSVTYF
jgi:hypothetical protein